MSIFRRKVTQATITYDDVTNKAAIVVKDKGVFPEGFKYVFRPDSNHAEMIRNHLAPGSTVSRERIADIAYLEDVKHGTLDRFLFCGVPSKGFKAPVIISQDETPGRIVEISGEDPHAELELFFKRQMLQDRKSSEGVINVDTYAKKAIFISPTGVTEDIPYNDLEKKLRAVKAPTLVSLTHHTLLGSKTFKGAYWRSPYELGIKSEVSKLVLDHSVNKNLIFLIPAEAVEHVDMFRIKRASASVREYNLTDPNGTHLKFVPPSPCMTQVHQVSASTWMSC